LVGCCVLVRQLAANKCHRVFYFYHFCVAPFDIPNNGTEFPHALHPLRTTSPELLSPTMLTLGWLLCHLFKFWPLKAKATPIAFYLMGYALAFQMKEPTVAPPKPPAQALHGLVQRRCAKSWGRGGGCHGNREQRRWGVGRRWIILVGCCVFCGAV
jgi:hypothetical protein